MVALSKGCPANAQGHAVSRSDRSSDSPADFSTHTHTRDRRWFDVDGGHKGLKICVSIAKLAIERGWIEMHESGTYVKFTQAGAELFA
jgi:hypothetical protein